ncbi:hypothetical protein SCHPADRAFT_492199 [Schizopora paradoxa]|uniref:Uncharacterized protein n=1 Tax=Schizopora paradoxa TaxID=27342 RepID=A0A0H2S212_9AGAM|nr:hypothetical protein SCHPADRAFT_492199 [Schizopora paradoxa]
MVYGEQERPENASSSFIQPTNAAQPLPNQQFCPSPAAPDALGDVSTSCLSSHPSSTSWTKKQRAHDGANHVDRRLQARLLHSRLSLRREDSTHRSRRITPRDFTYSHCEDRIFSCVMSWNVDALWNRLQGLAGSSQHGDRASTAKQERNLDSVVLPKWPIVFDEMDGIAWVSSSTPLRLQDTSSTNHSNHGDFQHSHVNLTFVATSSLLAIQSFLNIDVVCYEMHTFSELSATSSTTDGNFNKTK